MSVQTLWANALVAALGDAGVRLCVVSPGSRSTPLTAALAAQDTVRTVTLIDERAAAFFALGAARASGEPAALVCTSGTAAAHYLPALVEASLAGVPLIAITADRPPALWECGASQTIDQTKLYGDFTRGFFELGLAGASLGAFRALRRKVVQAATLARGPLPGPVHLNAPFEKPLEPAAPSTDDERALAAAVAALRGPALVAAPSLAADAHALAALAAAIVAEPHGAIVAGALPAGFPRDAVFALAARAGYPILAEAASQLRFGPRPAGVVFADHFDLCPAAPQPRLLVQLGAEPVAAAWPAFAAKPARWVLASRWLDPDGAARVILGDPAASVAALDVPARANAEWLGAWRDAEARAAAALESAIAQHPGSEVEVLRAALTAAGAATVQIGNSLPIRTIDHAVTSGPARTVLSQRGAAGIDGLVASAAGATQRGPVLLVLGDVSFAHDLGGLLAARAAAAPLAIVVVDNGGGQIFGGLPVGRADLGAAFERHWLTPPGVDPAAVATALGLRAVVARSPADVAAAVRDALAGGVTVIHAPVSPTGARDVRRTAHELFRRL